MLNQTLFDSAYVFQLNFLMSVFFSKENICTVNQIKIAFNQRNVDLNGYVCWTIPVQCATHGCQMRLLPIVCKLYSVLVAGHHCQPCILCWCLHKLKLNRMISKIHFRFFNFQKSVSHKLSLNIRMHGHTLPSIIVNMCINLDLANNGDYMLFAFNRIRVRAFKSVNILLNN